MLNEFLFTKIKEEDIQNIWLQQDSPTSHTAEATLDVLRPVFEDRIISHRAGVVWPPWSCDLTLLNYYLWGVVKDKSYADKPKTIDALKDNTREAIGEIQPILCYADKPATIDALKANTRKAIGEKQLHTIDNVLKN